MINSLPKVEQISQEELRRSRRKTYRKNRELGMTRENAAIVAGYSRAVATRRATPLVVVDFQAEFERQMMTNREKVRVCIEGMNAMKTISVENSSETDRNGRKKREQIQVPDWAARYKWFEAMMKMCKQWDFGGAKTGDTNVLVIGTLAERIKDAREATSDEIKVKGACVENGKIVVDADYIEENRPLSARTKVKEAIDAN